jgi:ABC-2 type transport system permease protein
MQVIIVTTSYLLIQYVIVYNTPQISDPYIWRRAAIFGMWSSVISSIGIINMNKYIGVLKYILNSKINPIISLILMILPTTTFGLLAFPLSYFCSILLGINVSGINFDFIVNFIFMYINTVIISLLMALILLKSPNGMIYESILVGPITILSGIFTIPFITNNQLILSIINPIFIPITNLLGGSQNPLLAIFPGLVFFILFIWLAQKLIYQIRVTGEWEAF